MGEVLFAQKSKTGAKTDAEMGGRAQTEEKKFQGTSRLEKIFSRKIPRIPSPQRIEEKQPLKLLFFQSRKTPGIESCTVT